MLMLVALFIPTGIPFSLYYGGGDWVYLLQGAVLTFAVGFACFALTGFKRKDYRENLRRREGYAVVAFAWVIISALGALPYVVSGAIPSYLDAYFETMSGFTATGATILVDIEAVPRGLLFWRAMTQWLGGMGIIVLSLAILPLLGASGTSLYHAEMPGPAQDKIHPRVQGIALRLWLIYVVLTVVLIIFLLLGGMSFYDSIAHSFTTISTAGFSTRNDSIAYYNSPYLQYVIIIFMFLGGTNFALHYHMLKGRFSSYFKDEEFRFYLIVCAVFTLIVAGTIYFNSGDAPDGEKAFRDAAFQVVSIITTTGYITADFESWSSYSSYLFLVMMFFGASAGSTTGGIKMMRILMLSKTGLLELRRLYHRHAVVPIRHNGRRVGDSQVHAVLAFFTMYILIFAAGSLILAALGMDFKSAVGAAAAGLGCVGPALGSVGPVSNFSEVPDAAKAFLCFLMLLGRLEIFTVFVLFSPGFWRT